MSAAVDAFVAYHFLRLLTTPWVETDAYALGIIDENGKLLKKRKELKNPTEKKAYTIFHRLVWNIKRLLDKLPAGQTRVGSFAAGLWMLKEHSEIGSDCLENAFYRFLEEHFPDILTNPEKSSILFEMNFSDMLPRGRYRLLHEVEMDDMTYREGDILDVRIAVPPVGEIAGETIFRIETPNHPDGIIVSLADIERID